MIRALLLFLALTLSGFAQDFYIDTPVSVTQVTATNVTAGTVSASQFVGDGSGLLFLPPSATVPMRAADVWSTPIDPRAYGAICDWTVQPGNLDAIHLAASLAIGNIFKTVIDLPPECVWGTNTTNGAETPIVLQDNTTLRVFGRQKMAVNNSTTQGLIVTKAGYSDGDLVSATNIDVIGMAGSSFDTISRTDLSVSWKMILLGNCNNCSIRSVNISTTTFLGSFAIQGRNPTNMTIENNTLNLMPSPDGRPGGDGIHLTGNVNGAYIANNRGRSVDDFVSLTAENLSMANKFIRNVRIVFNKAATYAYSGLKLFIGNQANNSIMEDVIIDGNQFSVWGPKGVDGNGIKIQQETGVIRNIRFGINQVDDTNGNGVAVLLTAVNPCGVDNVDLGRIEVKNYPSRAIEIDGNVCNTKSSGAIVGPWLNSPTTVLSNLAVTALLRTGANTATVYFTSATSVASVSTAGTQYLTLSGMGLAYNNWTALITARDVTNSTVGISVVGVSTSTNEAGVSATGTVTDRGTGVAIYDRGSFNTMFENLTIIDPPTLGYQWTTYNGTTYPSTSVPSISYFAENTAKLTISTSTANLSTESPYSGYLTTSSFTNPINNVTNAKIVGVSPTGKFLLVRIPGITSATDEANTSATVTSIFLPTNGSVANSKIVSQSQSTGLSIQAGQGIALRNNRCVDFAGNVCMADSNSVNVSGTVAIGNADEGMNRRTKQSFNFQDAQYDEIYLNKGTNSDWFSKVRDLVQLNSTGISASTVTIASNLAAANVSATAGLTRLLDVSATGGVSVTGNVSANKFIGDGSGLLNVPSTVASQGPVGTFQVAGTASTTIAASGTAYNSSTQEVSFTGNVLAGNVSGSRVMGTSSGSCSNVTIQVQAQNNGLYRPNSNQLGLCAGAVEPIRLSANSVSITQNLTVSGTISTSLAGATSRTLCVSPNGAIYASPTCP